MQLNICDCCGKRMTTPGPDGKPLTIPPKVTVKITHWGGECDEPWLFFEFCKECQSNAALFITAIQQLFDSKFKKCDGH